MKKGRAPAAAPRELRADRIRRGVGACRAALGRKGTPTLSAHLPRQMLALIATLSTGVAASGREDVNFNFGWTHRYGLHPEPPLAPPGPPPTPSPCTPGTFKFNATSLNCDGLTKNAGGDASAKLCEAACCAQPTCNIWQWAPGGGNANGCWMGEASCASTPSKDHAQWVGGARHKPSGGGPSPSPGGGPGADPPEAQPKFDASGWEKIATPHDSVMSDGPLGAVANKDLCANGCSGRSYLPRRESWYRKEFTLPSDYTGSSVWLWFEGVFRDSYIFLNGVQIYYHDCGYTSFPVRIDNATSVVKGGKNVLAVFVDPNTGKSGWWYEGGGIYRNVHLVKTNHIHIEQDGLFAFSNISGLMQNRRSPSLGMFAESAVLHASASVVNDGAAAAEVCATFSLADETGKSVGSVTSQKSALAAGATVTLKGDITVTAPELWTSPKPYLYNLTATITPCGSADTVATPLDALSTSTGFRALRYDADHGFFLNEQHYKVRGFCDHNDLANVGMAVTDRLHLFRAQASRSVGGNGRRTSHNPAAPIMLDIYDRIGITVMDENREFDNNTEYVNNMGAMVKRDRNHPSIIIWSFCNEAGCEGRLEAGGPAFKAITYAEDGSRPVLANMFTFNDLLSKTIDVQGFSHQSRSKLDSCHAQMPDKPIFMSECCSCNTQRDENIGIESSDGGSNAVQKSFNADCVQSQTNASNGADYAVGTMVW